MNLQKPHKFILFNILKTVGMRKLIVVLLLFSIHYFASAQLIPGTIGNNQTIAYRTAPATLTFITLPSGGTSPYTFQWQRSNNRGVSYSSISGATQNIYSPPVLTQTTMFRCRITDAASLIEYTNAVTITILIGTIGNNQTIPNRSAPAQLVFTSGPSGGTSPYLYQWQRSNNLGGSYSNISGATLNVYSPPVLAQTTMFRCRVTDAASATMVSNSVTITVLPNLIAGTIGNPQTICYNGVAAGLTGTDASGGTPPYSYQWQYTINGLSWSNIPGATLSGYSPAALTVDTWFRRFMSDASGRAMASNSVKITVIANLIPGTIGSAQTISNGATPVALTEIQAASGGSGSYSYRWQNSPDGLNWSDIDASNSPGFSPPALTADTWYRRVTIDGSCGSLTSNTIKITVFTPITLYTSEVPNYSSYWRGYVNMGTEFQVLTSGFITAVRLYTSADEAGDHQIRIWRQNDQSSYDIVTGPIVWNISDPAAGWRTFNLPSPLSVEAGRHYIVSITTGADNFWWVQLPNNLIPYATNDYVRYIRGLLAPSPGSVPFDDSDGLGFFRDIVFIPFSPGTTGSAQSICYSTSPAPLTQITAPTGGFGEYTYQWQSSTDGTTWVNIQGATSQNYSPPALAVTTSYRRVVSSGTLTANCSPILITVDSQLSLAQIHEDITIFENSSTYLNVTISGGTPPYRIEYTRNGAAQTPVENYVSGTGIFTGVLSSGTYIYALTNVTDALGCTPQSLGTQVTVTVSGTHSGSAGNKALVIVNSGSTEYYYNYTDMIKPYLDWFGIPYDVCDINSTLLPDLNNYALIIFGHRAVYREDYPEGQQVYPIAALETAISGGVGLYSFDPHLFDFESAFNTLGETHPDFYSSQIDISTDHYITQYHANDIYNPTNNIVPLNVFNDQPQTIHIWAHSYYLTGTNTTTLASMSSGGITEPLLEVANYGNGRIAKWSAYLWAFDDRLGPVHGMDDIVWRGIVWAARKPFVMQGMPPMITMRVDDVDATGTNIENNFEWLNIANEFGFIPWCGTFSYTMSPIAINTLRALINSNHATASPHAFGTEDYIYYNVHNLPDFSPSANVIAARNFYTSNSLPMSKYLVPHAYLLSSDALTEIRNMGIEYIGIPIQYDQLYNGSTDWLSCGPYRINRPGNPAGGLPVYYGGKVNWLGNDFFISLTEIRDDGGYEWYPDNGDIATVTARGVRHLRRALNSMVLPTLFTHEYRLANISTTDWRQILSGLNSAISSYNPEYRSMDYAVQYVRAKVNMNITNVTDDNNMVNISCSGINDMETRCYLFTGSGNQINMRLINLPQVSSTSIAVTVGVLK
jgi:hypothetical protein